MTCSRRKIIQFESIPLKYLSWLLKRLSNMHDPDMLVFYFLERALNQATIRCWMLCFLEHLWKSHQIFMLVISQENPLIIKLRRNLRDLNLYDQHHRIEDKASNIFRFRIRNIFEYHLLDHLWACQFLNLETKLWLELLVWFWTNIQRQIHNRKLRDLDS